MLNVIFQTFISFVYKIKTEIDMPMLIRVLNLKQNEARSARADPPDVHRHLEDVSLVEFMYLVFTRLPHESYRRRLRSLLFYFGYLLFVTYFELINSLVC